MRKDWRAMAKACGLEASDLDRIAGPLEKLEQDFHAMAMDLKAEDEPSVVYNAEPAVVYNAEETA